MDESHFTIPQPDWTDVVPETTDTLSSASTQGGKLFLTYARDVTSHPYVYSLEGEKENEVALPGPGTAGGFGGRQEDTSAFYAFYLIQLSEHNFSLRHRGCGKSSDIPRVRDQGFRAEDYETVQVFYPSKDGTRVPMFLVFKRGLKLDGNNPTLLYGYGGFNITVPLNSIHCVWLCWSRGLSMLRPICGAAASTAKPGTRRG